MTTTDVYLYFVGRTLIIIITGINIMPLYTSDYYYVYSLYLALKIKLKDNKCQIWIKMTKLLSLM